MITIRPRDERGGGHHGWLETRHTFSFSDYYDPAHMGFSVLRVINEDWIAPGAGFPTHGHRDMEIITYVLEGAVAHKDSMGNRALVRAGEVQRMTAGTGVTHSEYNASGEDTLHLLQIWILPGAEGLEPGYEQVVLDDAAGQPLALIGAPPGAGGAVTIHQDARLYVARPADGTAVDVVLEDGRRAWLHVARGEVAVGGEPLRAGDGAAVVDQATVTVTGVADGEVLVFDLP